MDDALQDIKHKVLIFNTGIASGSIDDLELIFIHNHIISPVKASHINDAYDQWFDEVGIEEGQLNDRMYSWLTSVGHLEDDLNAKWLSFWTSQLP